MSRLLLSSWSIARISTRRQASHYATSSLRHRIPSIMSSATPTTTCTSSLCKTEHTVSDDVRSTSTSASHSGDVNRHTATGADRYKLVFFVPIENAESCKEAIFATGAGSFPGGKYTKCCFQTIGTGQFLPNEGANPAIGAVGAVEKCEEARIEVMCLGREVMLSAVDALIGAHPYEEVAYEVYRMENV